MKSPLNQLILLGFVAQALSSENYFIVFCSILLWAGCLSLRRVDFTLSPVAECGLIGAGTLIGYLLSIFGLNIHFFIGYGLTLVQAGRLVRPLARREKIFAFIIAFFQLAVGCSVVLDYRFIPLLLATLIMIPRALIELETERFAPTANVPKRRMRLSQVITISFIMILFFVFFPRSFLGARLPNPRGSGDEGSLADTILDASRGGARQSSRVLLQIAGDKLNYLRCFSLVHFDGRQWTADANPRLEHLQTVPFSRLGKYHYRWVRVKNAAYLGKLLPTDGRVVQLRGNFFVYPAQNIHGGLVCSDMWNTPNNRYEFWISDAPDLQEFTPSQRRAYTNYPPQSARLGQWLEQRAANGTNSLQRARILTRYLRDNFQYKLGAPDLNRLNPIDDFIFNQREGHCERFASALALLLRMEGIPTRIMLGYAPNRRDPFSGWFNVRFKDAHSWTEAYIDELGWVELDATPRGQIGGAGGNWRDWLEDLDFAWYANIVNFDNAAQSRLLGTATQAASQFLTWAQHNRTALVGGGAALVILLTLARSRKAISRNPGPGAPPDLPSHYYGQMLRLLEKHDLIKKPEQTPFEYLGGLKASGPGEMTRDVEFITEVFCSNRYGHRRLADNQESQLGEALKRIKKMLDGKSADQGRFPVQGLLPDPKVNRP